MRLLLCLCLWSGTFLLVSCQYKRVLDLPGQIELLTRSFDAHGLIQQQFAEVLASAGTFNWTDIIIPAQPTGDVSQQCRDDGLQYAEDLLQRKPYALNMFDAGGKPPSGILYGNIYWLGSYSQCVNVTKKGFNIGFDAKYYTATLMPMSSILKIVLFLGVCVPSSCTEHDVIQRLDNSLYFRLLVERGILQVTDAHSPEATPIQDKTIVAICVCTFLLLLVAMGTVFDVFIHQPAMAVAKGSEESKDEERDKTPHTAVNGELADERTPLINSTEQKQAGSGAITGPNVSGRILLCFSLYTNIGKLLSTKQAPGSIRCLHGIRFLSMSWVILAHTYIFVAGVVDNPVLALPLLGQFTFQAVGNAFVSVDSFFFLSGLLTAYLLLKQIRKSREKGKSVPYWMLYIHRYWRLTMPYMFVLMLWVCVWPYLFVGPLWPGGAGISDPSTFSKWWTNLLYINNLVDPDKMCMGWSWYLANDMQFFIIGVPVIYLLARWWYVGFAVKLALLLSSFIATAVISVHYHFGPSLIQQGRYFFSHYYVAPHCRIGPYLVGITVGWLLVRIKDNQVNRKAMRIVAPFGWAVATASALAVLYGLYGTFHGTVLTDSVSAFYLTVHRTVWGMALGWMVLACFYGYGGVVNTILSWDLWVPLSRLTYCAYLVHPMVIYAAYQSREVTAHYTTLVMIYFFIGHLVLSYGVAFVVSVTVEAPLLGLEKIVFGKV